MQMKIVMIGAGNVATHLGKAFKESGFDVAQVWSRTKVSAMQLASALGCAATNDISQVCADADLYVVSVKDDALPAIVSELCPSRRKSMFVHTAGSVPMSCFEDYAKRYGVLYPMQTFTKDKKLDFRQIPIFLEASDNAVYGALQKIADSVSDHVYKLDGEGRKWLHLSAVFACNFSNFCYAVASRLLQRNGIPFDVMLPLVDETARKAHVMNPVDAQTGPASRHDHKVMERQMEMLRDDKILSEIYRLMSEGIERNAENKKK